jgi:hypothetical protein
MVWSAVVQPALPEDWEIPEHATLLPEEVRLLASIALCEADPWNNGWPIVTHYRASYHERTEFGMDFTSESTRERIAAYLTTLNAGAPPIPYSIRDVGRVEDALSLLENCDAEDELLLAGLSRLLESFRLMTTANEPEAASLSLFVSMGAATEFIRQHLEHTQSRQATFADVYSHLKGLYPYGDDFVEFLEEMYEHRVIATHPSSRLGDYWTPPLMTSDVYHLRKYIMGIYRHILLGETPVQD